MNSHHIQKRKRRPKTDPRLLSYGKVNTPRNKMDPSVFFDDIITPLYQEKISQKHLDNS